ncbi:unnamed protein product [Arabis nemorensis]|uniref:Major facilitator superfamily (MFS) profile domain-containing protein n=1 Tax=Arabis nemorensis TaxID=586526 RepID=A0A565CDA9_9BRAS|nr:unnamed protein product [Arabis nemorensis]
MVDYSTPLLTHLEDEEDTSSSPLTFDKIIEQSLSDFGFSQFLQILLVGLALTFDSQQIFITVFTDAYPTWHCIDHTICNPTTTDICKIPRAAWDWESGFKGVFLAMIPDGFLGRKQLLFFTTLAMSLTGISIFFSSNIWIYAFLKFVIGFACSQTGTYALVLISEQISTKWRPRAIMIP